MISAVIAVLTVFSLSVRFSHSGIDVFQGKRTISVRFHGEDVPEPVLLESGGLALFYPVTYRIEVFSPDGTLLVGKKLVKGYYELESYSAFDADEEKVAVAYRYGGKTHLKIVYFNGRTEERTFDDFFPAGLWIRKGKTILRLYGVKNNHVTDDFIVIGKREIKIPGVIAVDLLKGNFIYATKYEVLYEGRRIPLKEPILDMRVNKGRVYLLLGDGTVGILENGKVYGIGKVEHPFPRLFVIRDRLLVLTEEGESHEF